MDPTLQDGQIVVFSSLRAPREDRIVLAQRNGREYVKRAQANGDSFELVGDNTDDSLSLHDVRERNICGSLIYTGRSLR